MLRRSLLTLVPIALLASACGAGEDMTPPSAPPPPPPPPPSSQHLYTGTTDVPGHIYVYELPITSASTPSATLPLDKVMALGVNSTTLAVSTLDNTVVFYHLPISSASTPYTTVNTGSFGEPLFLPNGTLYHGGTDAIKVWTPPFTSASVSSGTIATPGITPTKLAIDPAGRVYETTNTVGTIGVVTNGALSLTFNAGAGLAFHGLAATSTELYACESTGSANHVYVYTLPLAANSTPTLIMNPNTFTPNSCAFDASGNFYIGASGMVVKYTPPFTANPARAVTLTIPGTVNGIAIGP